MVRSGFGSPSVSRSDGSYPALLGGISSHAAAQAAKPIRIGYLMPFSGTEAQNGKDNQDGFNLYLAAINNTVAGRRIEALFADTEGKPDNALTKAKHLVGVDKVDLLMGIILTPGCYALAPYVREAKIPVAVSGNCGGFGLTTNPKYKSQYMVRFTQTSAHHVDPIVAYAIKSGLKRVALVTSDYGGGLQVGDYFGRSDLLLSGRGDRGWIVFRDSDRSTPDPSVNRKHHDRHAPDGPVNGTCELAREFARCVVERVARADQDRGDRDDDRAAGAVHVPSPGRCAMQRGDATQPAEREHPECAMQRAA